MIEAVFCFCITLSARGLIKIQFQYCPVNSFCCYVLDTFVCVWGGGTGGRGTGKMAGGKETTSNGLSCNGDWF